MLGTEKISLWPIISNKYKYFLSSDFTQRIILMFDLSFGCSCSVCSRRGHKRLYCKAISSSTAQVPHWQRQFPPSHLSSQYSSLWSEMFPFSSLIYLLSAYSLCLIEVFHFYLTTSTMPSPKRIYSLSQFVGNYPFWIFVFSRLFCLPEESSITCLHVELLAYITLEHSDQICKETGLAQHSTGDDTVPAQMKWGGDFFHLRNMVIHHHRWNLWTQHLSCNLSKPTQERGALAMQSVHIS